MLAVLVAGGLAALTATAAAAEPVAQVRGHGALTAGGSSATATAAAPGSGAGRASERGLTTAPGTIGSAGVELTATADGYALAQGTVTAEGISLLNGRVTVGRLVMTARSGASPDGFEAGLSRAESSGVTVDGQAISPTPGMRVELPGVGAVIFFERAEDGAGTLRANALRLEISEDGGLLRPGERFVVGHVQATVRRPDAAAGAAPSSREPTQPRTATAPTRSPKAAPTATTPKGPQPPRTTPRESTTTEAVGPTPPATTEAAPDEPPATLPLAPTSPAALPRQPAPTASLVPTQGGRYVFPIHGTSNFIDDYGFPRSSTGWHHGVDIFATAGTPVLAVADGTLDKVGVNRLGGNRLWLIDGAGNEFYYAHLSAYAPATVTGARVSAGQVIGFVGNSGEALTTPPHLHFEVHPGGGDSINPYPYLTAWERRGDIPLAFRAAAESNGAAPASGAVLVGVEPAADAGGGAGDGLATVAR